MNYLKINQIKKVLYFIKRILNKESQLLTLLKIWVLKYTKRKSRFSVILVLENLLNANF